MSQSRPLPSWGSEKEIKNIPMPYSRTSIARTPMARTRFWVPTKYFQLLKKTNTEGNSIISSWIFLCCMYSESPYRGDSNEYSQHSIIVLMIARTSLNYRHLLPDLALWLTLNGSYYPYLEQIFMGSRMFEPLRFDWIWNHRRTNAQEP